jgi:hypothetical protein
VPLKSLKLYPEGEITHIIVKLKGPQKLERYFISEK